MRGLFVVKRVLQLIPALCLLAALPARADNATERVRGHEPRMSYLDNGVVRFGVDLNAGGAITWLSPSGSDQNLINSFDFGRQIQMSYYSGPVPFSASGKQPKPEWKLIGWNPIQVGDAFGNPSKVLEERNDGKEIHIKCTPMHWPLDNVPGECTFECWFELEGSAVHARCRLINHRPDHTQYPARRQELPAIYTNGPWYRLMTYAGDAPFTHADVTRIVKDQNERGPWSSWLATEHWAALLDDHDFGLGIYIPHVIEFGGGFAGTPGAGGPQDSPTGYIAPHPNEIIDWNIEHEYRYDLVLGTLPQIREYVYAHAKPATPPSYQFEKDRQGWTFVHASDPGWPISGQLDVSLDQDDPQLIGPVGFWHAGDAGTLVIEAASNSSRNDARVFWKNFDDRSFSETKSAGFALTCDASDHQYRVKLSDHPAWKGAIIQLRFDPIGSGARGEWIRIKSIRLEK